MSIEVRFRALLEKPESISPQNTSEEGATIIRRWPKMPEPGKTLSIHIGKATRVQLTVRKVEWCTPPLITVQTDKDGIETLLVIGGWERYYSKNPS